MYEESRDDTIETLYIHFQCSKHNTKHTSFTLFIKNIVFHFVTAQPEIQQSINYPNGCAMHIESLSTLINSILC